MVLGAGRACAACVRAGLRGARAAGRDAGSVADEPAESDRNADANKYTHVYRGTEPNSYVCSYTSKLYPQPKLYSCSISYNSSSC